MQKEILEALVEMIRQGGTLAVWGIFVYLLMGIIKVAVTGGFLWITIKCVATNWRGYLERKLDSKAQSLKVFSDKASTRLVSCLDSYHKEVEIILKDIQTQLENLKKNSKSRTKSATK